MARFFLYECYETEKGRNMMTETILVLLRSSTQFPESTTIAAFFALSNS